MKKMGGGAVVIFFPCCFVIKQYIPNGGEVTSQTAMSEVLSLLHPWMSGSPEELTDSCET